MHIACIINSGLGLGYQESDRKCMKRLKKMTMHQNPANSQTLLNPQDATESIPPNILVYTLSVPQYKHCSRRIKAAVQHLYKSISTLWWLNEM